MNEKIIHRIDKIRKHYELSYNAFDALFGFSNGYIGGQIRNERNVGSDVIEKIFSHFTEINPEWFLTGKGEMFTSGVEFLNEPDTSYQKSQSIDKILDNKIEDKLKELTAGLNKKVDGLGAKVEQLEKRFK